MYHVKVKRFLDSLQIQYFEAGEEKRQACETTTLFEDIRIEKEERFERVWTELVGVPYDQWQQFDFRVPFDSLEEDNEEEKQKSAESLRISRSRTIRKIYDYGKSNRWEWWLTFTFNKEKVDRYDFHQCSKKMSVWLMNIRKKSPEMKYLIVPEQHKDGAWHFHGLFSGIDSWTMLETEKRYNGKMVYNIRNFKFGFTYAIKTDGSMKIVGYLTKYITKSLCEATMGKKRYWVSRNLDLPDILEFNTYESFVDVISAYDVSQAYFKSVEGFKNINICEIPIYSTNTERFVESENEQKLH